MSRYFLSSLFPLARSFVGANGTVERTRTCRLPTAANFAAIVAVAREKNEIYRRDEKDGDETPVSAAWIAGRNAPSSPSRSTSVVTREKSTGEARARNARYNIRGTTGCGGATVRREDRGFVASPTLGRLRAISSRGAQPLGSNGPPRPART